MSESEYLYLSPDVSNFVYHIVCLTIRWVIDEQVDEKLRPICPKIEKRYRYNYIKFLEIGIDNNYVYFLVQSKPNYSLTQTVKIIKSITVRQIFPNA